MCGIAGFIDAECSRSRAAQLIDNMCKVIRHRGPDDQGVWLGNGVDGEDREDREGGENGVALGMRRLAIIDLAGGHQPVFNEDQSALVVFNGEIYNYRELRQELQSKGHHFSTDSDTETIVHAYEEYGDDCVNHLRGMFTFALWDRKRHRLLAARDRFGKKPFNYYWDGRRLIFGSEIKSILEAGIPREVNPVALDEYLVYGYVPSPNTLFKGVLKLPAAHILVYENGQISTKRYWELTFTATCQDDEATAIERIRALLKEAVEVRLMSEVPLGAFLSGGIDSSIVVGLMSQMTTEPVKTFSIGFEEDDFSELPYARQIADRFGTDHHEFIVRPDLISALPELVWACDEPFADASILPTYYVSKLAREYLTVALTGDGGDEIFGGYRRYERALSVDRMPAPVRSLLGYGSKLLPYGMRGKKRFGYIHRDLPTRYVHADALFSADSRHVIYHHEYFAHVRDYDPYERLINEFRTAQDLDSMAQMQYVDARVYLTDDILVKVDKASMLNSLETRAPMLDQHLAEYVSSLPSTLRTRNHMLKYLLKRVAADMLPAEIISRPKKGFTLPIKHWFREDLIDYASDLLDSSRAIQRGIFNPRFVRNLLETQARSKLVNQCGALWALLCLELWFQVYMDQPSIQFRQNVQAPVISD